MCSVCYSTLLYIVLLKCSCAQVTSVLFGFSISLSCVSNYCATLAEHYHSDIVIPRMQRICPWAKLIVMLRNPTDRAFSQYQMCVDQSGERKRSSFFVLYKKFWGVKSPLYLSLSIYCGHI